MATNTSADIMKNLPETAEYFAMKDEVDKAIAFADMLTTNDQDGKPGELTSMTAVLNVTFNDGSSTRIHTSAEFNKYFVELVKANAPEFFMRTKLKANEMLALELADAESEVGGKLPGASAPAAPVIDGTLGASGQVGQAFSYTPSATNLSGAASIAWSATGLPASLTINPLTGAITGTPVAGDAGQHTVAVHIATNIGNDDATLILTIQAAAGTSNPISIDSALTATASVGNAFTYTATATGTSTASSVTWGATGLPSSLSIDPSTGVISGTPVAGDIGSHSVHITVTTDLGNDTKILALTIS